MIKSLHASVRKYHLHYFGRKASVIYDFGPWAKSLDKHCCRCCLALAAVLEA
jgi:hypothetical protein